MGLTQAQTDAALTRLTAIKSEVADHISSQFHAPFSGQPAADLKALNIAYDDGMRSLRNTQDEVINGDRAPAKWLALVDLVEDSMRSISGYDDGASARAEVNYIATEEVKTIVGGASSAVGWTLKNAFKASPMLVIGAAFIALLAIAFILSPLLTLRKASA